MKQTSYSIFSQQFPLQMGQFTPNYDYFVLFRSSLDYIFITCNNLTEKQFVKLEIQQQKLLKYCVGLMNSTPNVFVYTESAEHPLRLRKELILIKNIFKNGNIS